MAENVVNLENPDPVTALLHELYDLGPIAWSSISLASSEREANLWQWDEAYEVALAGGGGWAAGVAATAARAAGGGPKTVAIAAGAAAAVSARSALSDSQFDLLFAPVGEVLPSELRTQLQADADQAVYTSCMPKSSRPLPA